MLAVSDLTMGLNGAGQIHVLMFPWLAQGHISPFLSLSKALATHGVRVSFLSTPVNISRVRPLLQGPQSYFPGQIDLLELALPAVEGLPPGAECTADIPIEKAFTLKRALDGLQKPFESLLQRLSPDYVIHDFVQHWASPIAAKFGIPAILFLVFSPAASAYMFDPSRKRKEIITAQDLTTPPPEFPSTAISWRPHEARDMLVMYRPQEGQITAIDRVWKCFEGCCAIAIKSCFPTENKYMHFLQKLTGKPVLSVGPLLPGAPKQLPGNEDERYFLSWLDEKPPSSVVFVSFGSETFLTKEEIRELALGLEASQQPFLWALRFPRYLDSPDGQQISALDWLPEGFENRTRDRGIVVDRWVPQAQILSHSSVGGYLTHSGWGSVMEALMFGLPLILLPVRLDQSLNARQVVDELKAGFEVPRGADGSFSKEEIGGAVRMVMADGGRRGHKIQIEGRTDSQEYSRRAWIPTCIRSRVYQTFRAVGDPQNRSLTVCSVLIVSVLR